MARANPDAVEWNNLTEQDKMTRVLDFLNRGWQLVDIAKHFKISSSSVSTRVKALKHKGEYIKNNDVANQVHRQLNCRSCLHLLNDNAELNCKIVKAINKIEDIKWDIMADKCSRFEFVKGCN